MKLLKLNARFTYAGQFSLENLIPGIRGESIGSNLGDIDLSGVTTIELPSGTTLGGSSLTALGTITSSSAQAFAVGLNGLTNPAFDVDASTALQVAGLKVKGAVTGGTVALSVIDSGSNASLTLDAKGTGTVGINTVGASSGLVTVGNGTSLAGMAVNGLITGTSASATALAVGLNGATNPALVVDASTASSATGIKIKSAAATGGVALQVVSSGSPEALTIDAKAGALITMANGAASALGVQVGGSTSAANAQLIVQSTNAAALVVGRQGATNPVLTVNANTVSVITGLQITGAGTGAGVALAATDSGSNTALTLDAKGTGTLGINTVSTTSGLVTIGNATSKAGLQVNGQVFARAALKQSIVGVTLTALGAVQSTTPTAAQMIGGAMSHASATGAGTATFDTGTNLSAAITGVAVGDSFIFSYANIGSQTVTLTGNTGTTIVGTAALASGKNALVLCVNTGANTWNLYTIVSA